MQRSAASGAAARSGLPSACPLVAGRLGLRRGKFVERALVRWLLQRQGLDAAHCGALLHAPDDAALDALAWGKWRGREEEHFLEAARLIEPLSWAEVAAIGGRELAGLADALRSAVAHADERALPERVRQSGAVPAHLGLGGRVWLQHGGASLELEGAVAARLSRVQEARLEDLGLDDTLPRRLLDWRVLGPEADPIAIP